ncbi:hypothetical protein ACFQJC_13225 [Haloferax namakaokahaiae]|uniref:Uncharacterized protein n=1 Tax=Haloferax namakaokahaiae TaxID=1748331 RepID=A0ABD5ZGW3_9EURY
MDDELRLRLDALIFMLLALLAVEGFQLLGPPGAGFGLLLGIVIIYAFGPGLANRT